MPIPIAQELTRQFYEWEHLGRGWFKAEFAVDLEPPFTPFFGHYIDQPIIDDGKRPSLFASLFNKRDAQAIETKPTEAAPIEPYPYTEDAPLSIYTVVLPRHFHESAERMEQLLIMLSYRKSPVSFEITASCDVIAIQFVCREHDAVFLQTQVQAFFPECAVVETDCDALFEVLASETCLYTVDFGLQEEFMRPIATHAATDPYTALFGIMQQLQNEQHIIVQVLFSGTHNAWAESIMTAVCDDSQKASFFFDAPEMPKLAQEKISRPLYGVTIRTVTAAQTMAQAQHLLEHVATTMCHASTSASNALIPLVNENYTVLERLGDIVLRTSRRLGMLLNSRELATFVHFPSIALSRKLLANQGTTKAAPDACINQPYCLGINSHRGIEQQVGIGIQQRLRHVHIIGSTGTGKSTLLHSLIMQDIIAGTGCCVIDPHGDLIEQVLHNVPRHRISDVVLIDPSDSNYPISLNILSAHSDLEKELLASDLVALFRRFSTSWGDQMNSVFANAISAFVYNTQIGTLGDLRKFLIDQSFRNSFLSTCTDLDIVYYWQKEYPILKSSSVGSILTRLDSFLRPKVIRNMVCQKESLNFQHLMDTSKIILVKLSQGLLGEENSYLLGAFIVSKLQQTAMARQVQQAQSRIPFFCYIDEFQHFVTPSMASILSGARKYSLGLVLAHQDMNQVSKVDDHIASSVLSNAGTRICFRVGDNDAKKMQEGFSTFGLEDMQNLQTGEAIVRVNTKDQDFNIAVIPYTDVKESVTDEIIEFSRATYSHPLSQQEQSKPAEPIHEPQPANEPFVQADPITAPEVQKDVREHRYLQTFIKKLAEEHGYKANIEVPTPDKLGLVDVLLEREGIQIAIEISVTTPAVWELHNIKKCLAAGYGKVVVYTNKAAKASQIRARISSELPLHEQSKIQVITSEDIPTIFASKPNETVSTMKGYRVKVQYEQSGNANANDIIQRIVNLKK